MIFKINPETESIQQYLDTRNTILTHPDIGWQRHNAPTTCLYNIFPQYQLVTANTITTCTGKPLPGFVHTALFFDTSTKTYAVGHTSNRNTWNPNPVPWDRDTTMLAPGLSSMNSILRTLQQAHVPLDISGIHPAPDTLIDNIAHLIQHQETYLPFPKEPFKIMHELTQQEKEQNLGWSFSTLKQGSMYHCNPEWEVVAGLWDKEDPFGPVVAVFYDSNFGKYHVASCDQSSAWQSGIGMWQPSNTFYAGSSDDPYVIIGLVKNVLSQTDKYANFYASDVISLVTTLLEEAV